MSAVDVRGYCPARRIGSNCLLHFARLDRRRTKPSVPMDDRVSAHTSSDTQISASSFPRVREPFQNFFSGVLFFSPYLFFSFT